MINYPFGQLAFGEDENPENRINNLLQSQTIENITFPDAHVLVNQSSLQSQSIENITLYREDIYVQTTIQGQQIQSFGITQMHYFVFADLSQTQTIAGLNVVVSEEGRTFGPTLQSG